MAIEYTLYVDTDDPPLHMYGIMRACIGDESNAASTGSLAFSGDSLQGVVSVPDDLTRRFVSEDFSLDAQVQVILRLDKFEMERAQNSLARCVSEIVRAGNDDMILLFNGEMVVLRRRAGDLVLREGFGVWTTERLALFETPYRVGPA